MAKTNNFDLAKWGNDLITHVTREIEGTLHLIGNKLVADAVKRLKAGDKIAFGNLMNSVAYDVMVNATGMELSFGANAKDTPLKYGKNGSTPKFVDGEQKVRIPAKIKKKYPNADWDLEPKPYAKYVEEGRKAGILPPFVPILKWAAKKRHKHGSGFFGDMPVDQAAKKVQWGLKKRGTAPYPFLSWSIANNQDFIEQKIKEALGL